MSMRVISVLLVIDFMYPRTSGPLSLTKDCNLSMCVGSTITSSMFVAIFAQTSRNSAEHSKDCVSKAVAVLLIKLITIKTDFDF